jgi:hypothetical protein
MDVVKINDNEIQVTKQAEMPAPVVTTYSYGFLVSQKKSIQGQQDRDNAQKEKEKAEVREILGLCDKEGVAIKSEG